MFPMLLVFSILLSKCRVNMVRVMMRKMVVLRMMTWKKIVVLRMMTKQTCLRWLRSLRCLRRQRMMSLRLVRRKMKRKMKRKRKVGMCKPRRRLRRGEEKLMEKKGEVLRKKPK
ncbi:unnamed protein product, partial [Brassica rapa subsp. trilocularis]